MRLVYTCIFIMLGGLALVGQQMQFTAEDQLALPNDAEVNLPVSHYQVLDVQLANVYNQLSGAPAEFSLALRQSNATIDLPLRNGEWRTC